LRMDAAVFNDWCQEARIAPRDRQVIFMTRVAGFPLSHLAPAQSRLYYRLWEQDVQLAEKARFVGKHAQHAMHAACNDYAWHGVTQDKLLFHAAMLGAGLPVPEVVAVVHPSRALPGARVLATCEQVEAFLRDGASYPFFAKPLDGVYSLGVVSAERHDVATDAVALWDGTTRAVPDLAACLRRDPRPEVRDSALAALKHIDPDLEASLVIPTLVDHLQSDRPEDQVWAAQTLGDMGSAAAVAVPAFEQLLKSESPTHVLRAAANALKKIDYEAWQRATN